MYAPYIIVPMLYPPIKKLGQNFLISSKPVNDMVGSLDLTSEDVVVEIGPGLGVLTAKISDSGALIYAVEIDERFVSKLENMFLNNLRVKIVHSDVLEWLPTFETDEEFKILGSLPYYITSPILHTIVKMRKRPSACVLLTQNEVAKKISSKPPEASYLSTFVQTFFEVEYMKKVSRKVFRPIPKVDGGIVRLRKKESLINFDQIEKYEDFLHRGFSNPRKMLNKVFKKEMLESVSLDNKLRPQNVSVEKWVELFKKINSQ